MEKPSKEAGRAPSGDDFAQALNFYLECVLDRTASIEAFEKAQAAYIADANALPVPEVMRGPVVIVTDADPLEKVRSVLAMTTVGIGFQDRIAKRLAELIDYRNAKAALTAKYNIAGLGETALLGASAVQMALGRLIDVIGADDPDNWAEAANRYRRAARGWNILGDDYSNEEAEALSDVWAEYKQRMVQYPVTTAADFLEKVRLLTGDLGDADALSYSEITAIVADAERLFGESA